MSSNEPKTGQEKGPTATGAFHAGCCEFCPPGWARTFKRMAEQCEEATEQQTKAASSDTGAAQGGGCGGEGSGE